MLIVELLTAGAVASAPQPSPKAETARVYRNPPVRVDRCKGGSMMQALGKVPTPRARKLGDLPKANAELTVMRMVDGCVVPTVRYGVGR